MKTSVSRRGFLQTAGAGTVTMWIPTHASGYTAPEMREKAAAASTLGVSKWELDTPALCVDLDKMEANMATMRQKLAATGTGVVTRPHAKTHKCPAIAKLQLAAGAVGICTAKVSEAEALFANGVEKILMTTCERVGEQDPARDEDPQDEPRLHPGGRLPAERAGPVRRREGSGRSSPTWSSTSRSARAVGVSGRRTGARAGAARRQAAEPEAARHASATTAARSTSRDSRSALERDAEALRAVACSTFERDEEGRPQHRDLQRRRHRHLQHHDRRCPAFTDVQVGSYIFMDAQYLEIGGESNEELFTDFAPSLTVMTTILNNYFPKRLTTDAGTEGADAEQARSDRDRREGVLVHRRLGRVRHHPVRDRQQDVSRSATSSS